MCPAEEDDNASVVSVASTGAASKRATDTDSDASQASDAPETTVVVDLVTDEDESEPVWRSNSRKDWSGFTWLQDKKCSSWRAKEGNSTRAYI